MQYATKSCHKTEECTNVHAMTAAKSQKFLLNQNKEGLFTAENVSQNIGIIEDFRLVLFNLF